MYVNIIVYACLTMARRIFTNLSQIMYKLPEVVQPYRPSRQVAKRCSLFVRNVCTKCLDLSCHTGRRGRSEQLVATGSTTGSPRFLLKPCRAIIMSCRVATCRDTYVTNEQYCSPALGQRLVLAGIDLSKGPVTHTITHVQRTKN